jgi:cation:H+ antiporter
VSLSSALLVLSGFVLLVGGGEALVRGAASLARTMGMSALVVGLTVVSFATSSPELAVSAGAALSGSPGLAVGNVVGSNIANVLLVLGLCAIVVPLVVTSRVVRTDIPVMIGLSVLTLLLALDGPRSRGAGSGRPGPARSCSTWCSSPSASPCSWSGHSCWSVVRRRSPPAWG